MVVAGKAGDQIRRYKELYASLNLCQCARWMGNHIAIGLLLLCDHRDTRIKRSMGNSLSFLPVYGSTYRCAPCANTLQYAGIIWRDCAVGRSGPKPGPCPHGADGAQGGKPGVPQAPARDAQVGCAYPPRAPGGSRRGRMDAQPAGAGEHRPCGCAAPRRDDHEGASWEGVALPDPPVGRGPGARASGPHPQGDNRVLLGGLRPPRPSYRVEGWGDPVAPSPCGAGAWGNPVSPRPSPRAYVHVSPTEPGAVQDLSSPPCITSHSRL